MLETVFLSKFEERIVACELGVLAHLGSKNHTRKISNIHKIVELYQAFIHNFLCPTVSIYRNSNFTYYLHTTQAMYYLNNPILCHYVPLPFPLPSTHYL